MSEREPKTNVIGKVECMYNCKMCGLERQSCMVDEHGEGQDLKHWMDLVMIQAIAQDHRWRSPGCPSKKVDLFLPIDGKGVGMKPVMSAISSRRG